MITLIEFFFQIVGSLSTIVILLILWAATIDPGDNHSIKRRKDSNKPLPAFSRSQHIHVIENYYCNICEVKV